MDLAHDASARVQTLAGMIDTGQARWHDVAKALLKQYRANGISFNTDKTIEASLELTT